MKIRKREGYLEEYNSQKVMRAIRKVFEETNSKVRPEVIVDIANNVFEVFIDRHEVTVEEVQDEVENQLMKMGFNKEAKAYIMYREERTRKRNAGWQMDELQSAIWTKKYRYGDESFEEWLSRVSGGNPKVAKLIRQKKFTFAGRILAHRGLGKLGKRVTYSNCYVMSPPEDNIESIFDTAKELARTYSAGGGCGADISKLRPKGMSVNNSARTTSGATSFMSLYDLTTGLIGQNGRRK